MKDRNIGCGVYIMDAVTGYVHPCHMTPSAVGIIHDVDDTEGIKFCADIIHQAFMEILKVDVRDDIFVISDRKSIVYQNGEKLWKCGIVFDGDNRDTDFNGKDFEIAIETIVGDQ